MTYAIHTSGSAVRGGRTNDLPRRLARAVIGAFTARRERAILAALDDHTLADMGITRAQADAEAGRPIWDVPAHWLR